MKTCTACKEEKSLEEFYRDARTKDGRTSHCRECRNRSTREWYHRDPEARQASEKAYYERNRERIIARENERAKARREAADVAFLAGQAANSLRWRRKNPDKRRDYELRKRYGITLEQFEAMSAAQGGLCKICRGTQPGGGNLCVDHDAKTGKVRGLLCRPCNLGIGNLEHDIERLRWAIDYLNEYR